MTTQLQLEIHSQPDDTTCGPTCLHAVYRYFGDEQPLQHVIDETPKLEEGGTLAVHLACHALRRGYKATIFTYNLHVFDPTWFEPDGPDMRLRLKAQMERKHLPKLQAACSAYIKFIELGGKVLFRDLTPEFLRKYLKRGIPILTGLNATYLYRCARERMDGEESVYDDVEGEPTGHFVVVHGYDRATKGVSVADPYSSNPVSPTQQYQVKMDHLLCAIMLGIVTYDANLLIIEPKTGSKVNC